MNKKRVFSIYLDVDLIVKLDEVAKDSGVVRSLVVDEAIVLYLRKRGYLK